MVKSLQKVRLRRRGPNGGLVVAGHYEFNRNIECGTRDAPEPPVNSACGDDSWIAMVARFNAAHALVWARHLGAPYVAGHHELSSVAILPGTWEEKPENGLLEEPGQDYAMIEAALPVAYEFYEHAPLTELLVTTAKSAVRAEVWGDLYAQEHLGVHQIHSRRASCAVTRDIKGRDGALKLYYADNTTELFLFKFCGQP